MKVLKANFYQSVEIPTDLHVSGRKMTSFYDVANEEYVKAEVSCEWTDSYIILSSPKWNRKVVVFDSNIKSLEFDNPSYKPEKKVIAPEKPAVTKEKETVSTNKTTKTSSKKTTGNRKVKKSKDKS